MHHLISLLEDPLFRYFFLHFLFLFHADLGFHRCSDGSNNDSLSLNLSESGEFLTLYRRVSCQPHAIGEIDVLRIRNVVFSACRVQ